MKPSKKSTESKFAAIWGNQPEIASRGFVSTPVLLLRYGRTRLGLSAEQVLFIQVLHTWKWDGRNPYPTQADIAEASGVTSRQIRNLREGLVLKGHLKIIPGHRGKADAYDFSPLYKLLADLAKELKQEEVQTAVSNAPDSPPAPEPLPAQPEPLPSEEDLLQRLEAVRAQKAKLAAPEEARPEPTPAEVERLGDADNFVKERRARELQEATDFAERRQREEERKRHEEAERQRRYQAEEEEHRARIGELLERARRDDEAEDAERDALVNAQGLSLEEYGVKVRKELDRQTGISVAKVVFTMTDDELALTWKPIPVPAEAAEQLTRAVYDDSPEGISSLQEMLKTEDIRVVTGVYKFHPVVTALRPWRWLAILLATVTPTAQPASSGQPTGNTPKDPSRIDSAHSHPTSIQ